MSSFGLPDGLLAKRSFAPWWKSRVLSTNGTNSSLGTWIQTRQESL